MSCEKIIEIDEQGIVMDLIVKLGLGLGLVVALILVARWLYNRGQDRQALQDTLKALERTNDARDREKAIQEAAKRVRDTPGPVVPDFLRPGPGSPPASP